jgi:hypothetical protein
MLYDVGMTANLASDMIALAQLGDALCAAPHSLQLRNCSRMPAGAGPTTESKIQTLRKRAAELVTLTQAHLWDEVSGAFVNKLPGLAYNLSQDRFYRRVSPTSLYPLMTGAPTTQQAERLARGQLLSKDRFCITPADEWPPHVRQDGSDKITLQTWTKGSDFVVCSAGASCTTWQEAGYSHVRNESVGWSSAAGGTPGASSSAAEMVTTMMPSMTHAAAPDTRTALYQYRLATSNQTVLGRAGDFPPNERVSAVPLVWVAAAPPQAGAWPLQLWRGEKKGAAAAGGGGGGAATSDDDVPRWRVVGSPDGNVEINNDQRNTMTWRLDRTLGWALPLPNACYWSVSFEWRLLVRMSAPAQVGCW